MNIKLCAFADEVSEQLTEQIAFLKDNNIPYIEIRGINGKNISQITEEEAEIYKSMLDEGGIKAWSIGSPIGKVSANGDIDAHLENAEHIFKLAKIFGTNKIRTFSLFTQTPEADEEKVFAFIERLLALAKKHGMQLYHENEKEIYGDTAKRCKKLVERYPDLNSIFDPANYVQCDVNMDEAFALMGEHTGYYHIKDAIYGTGSIVPAGDGDGKVPEMISRINKDTVLTLEPHLAVFSGYSHIDKSVMRHEHEYATSHEAFTVAVGAIKKILRELGYTEEGNSWIK